MAGVQTQDLPLATSLDSVVGNELVSPGVYRSARGKGSALRSLLAAPPYNDLETLAELDGGISLARTCVGNGTTEDTQGILDAFAAAEEFGVKRIMGHPGQVYYTSEVQALGGGASDLPTLSAAPFLFEGRNAEIKLKPGSVLSTIYFNAFIEPIVRGWRFTGTSDAEGTYDATNLQGGLRFSVCAFPTVADCYFTKFISHAIRMLNIVGTTGTGSTNTRGGLISRNVFEEFPVDDAATPNINQTCILLNENGEYVQVLDNRAYHCCSLIRGTGGAANLLISRNESNSGNAYGAISAQRAVIYLDFNAAQGQENSGKFEVFDNVLNHNGVNQPGIYIEGDPAKQQNISSVCRNHILVHLSEIPVRIRTSNHLRFLGNIVRMQTVAAATGPAVELIDCDNSIVDDNYISVSDGVTGGTSTAFALELDSSVGVELGERNTFVSETAANKVALTNGATVDRRSAQSWGFSVLGATNTTSNLPSGWSFNKNGTGDYTITTNFSTDDYDVVASPDQLGSAIIVAVRKASATSIGLESRNSAGTATDARITVLVKARRNGLVGL